MESLMRKLPPTAANVRFVADELARDLGSRENVSLGHVRALVGGRVSEVVPHFGAWLADEDGAAELAPAAESLPAPEASSGFEKMIGDLERRMVGAIRDGAASRRPATAAARRGAADGDLRNATEEELREVVRFALSDAEPEAPKSFLTDVSDHRQAPARRNGRPADVPRARGKLRPDMPKSGRRQRSAARREAVRAAVVSSPARKLRRIRDSDWKGAANRLVARHAATTLRNFGYPLMPTEICTDIAARGGPVLRKPGRDLPAQLEGSRMVRVGVRGQFWFEGETPPKRPATSERRDTVEALNRELAARLFETALGILRGRGREGMSVKALKAALGPEASDFNRDWLVQRLKRAVADPKSPVAKIPGGFAYVEGRKRRPAAARKH
jgi:hypothetical protein